MQTFPQVKICGINDVHVAVRAEELGADYLGFIFAERSPRRVEPRQAAAISASLSAKARLVGVFTESPIGEIVRIAKCVPMDVVQLHSMSYGADEIDALRSSGFEVWRLDGGGGNPDAVVLDGRAVAQCGGTGRSADWLRATALSASGVRVVLAGGISAENASAAAKTGCAVLDVNSSLEVRPGVKSIARMEAFFRSVAPLRREGTARQRVAVDGV